VPNTGSCATGTNGLQVYGNIFQRVVASCGGGTFAYDVFTPGGSTCGSNAKLCTVTFAQPVPAFGGAKPDGHLASSDTCATDAADPVRFPAVDADGESRPVGVAPDAGMDELGGVVTPPPADTTSPLVSLTAPAAGATVSGQTTVTASASDNVGVVEVTFMVDGLSVGSVGVPPYSLVWASTSVPDGSHTITAVARDAAGNSASSAAVAVTVSNSSPPQTTVTNLTRPTISGSAVRGATLLLSNGTWRGSPTSFLYSWQRCNTDGTGCANIAGATSASYRVQSVDRGRKLRGSVTASNGTSSASAFSDLTATVRRN
jgi:hypothetical protein